MQETKVELTLFASLRIGNVSYDIAVANAKEATKLQQKITTLIKHREAATAVISAVDSAIIALCKGEALPVEQLPNVITTVKTVKPKIITSSSSDTSTTQPLQETPDKIGCSNPTCDVIFAPSNQQWAARIRGCKVFHSQECREKWIVKVRKEANRERQAARQVITASAPITSVPSPISEPEEIASVVSKTSEVSNEIEVYRQLESERCDVAITTQATLAPPSCANPKCTKGQLTPTPRQLDCHKQGLRIFHDYECRDEAAYLRRKGEKEITKERSSIENNLPLTVDVICSNPKCLKPFTRKAVVPGRTNKSKYEWCSDDCSKKGHNLFQYHAKKEREQGRSGKGQEEQTEQPLVSPSLAAPAPLEAKCQNPECGKPSKNKYCCYRCAQRAWVIKNKKEAVAKKKVEEAVAPLAPSQSLPTMADDQGATGNLSTPNPITNADQLAQCGHRVSVPTGTLQPIHCGDVHCEEWTKFLANKKKDKAARHPEAENLLD